MEWSWLTVLTPFAISLQVMTLSGDPILPYVSVSLFNTVAGVLMLHQ